MFSRLTTAATKPGTLHTRPVKKHGNATRRAAVVLPPGEDINEWMAANLVDFFNEISLLFGLCADAAAAFSQPGDGFPPGFEYRWQTPGTKDAKPIRCSSPEYIDYVLTWIEDQVNNEDIFPVTESQPFPPNFQTYVKDIFRRMFRIFAIIYHRFFATIESLDAAAHLNTCFKHFAYFIFEFSLVDEGELKALKGPIDRLRAEFDASVEAEREEAAAAAAAAKGGS